MNHRTPLLGLLFVLALGGIAAFWMLSSDQPEAEPAAAGAVAPPEEPKPTEGGPELSLSEDLGRDATVLSAGVEDELSALGVRAHGEGRLQGRVVGRHDGRPVGGARVELHGMLPTGGPLVRRIVPLFGGEAEPFVGSGEPIAIVASDATGGFQFEGVRPGQWFIQARGERSVPDGVAKARVSASGDGGPVDVWVRPGGRVVGTVLRPDGSGAAGARLMLISGVDNLLESLRNGDLCVLETTTAGDGSFAISGVPPGPSYDLYAEGSAFAVSFLTGIGVAAGQDTEVTLRTTAGGTISGRIVSVGNPDQPRAPLAGAHVAAVPHGLRYLPFAAAVLGTTHSVSGEGGGFRLTRVPPGDVDLLAVAPGHSPDMGPTVFVLEGADAAAPEFELSVGQSVSGRVVDASGEPLAGVKVTWNPVDFDGFGLVGGYGQLVARAIEGLDFPTTGADGRFVAGAFPGDPPHELTFNKRGYVRKTHYWEPDDEPAELEIVMGVGGYVEGIVMDVEKTEPLQSFYVRSEDMVPSEGGLPLGTELFSGRLVEDPGGRFRIGPLSPGSVDIGIDADDYSLVELTLEVAAGETVKGVIVEMYGGQRVYGRVVDENGNAVSGALVLPKYTEASSGGRRGRRERIQEAQVAELGALEGVEEQASGPRQSRSRHEFEMPAGLTSYAAQLGIMPPGSTRTAPDGSFELRGVEPGPLIVAAVHRDNATSWSEPIEVVEDGAAVEVLIEMERGGAVYGRVTDRYERPVDGAIVMAVSPNQMGSDTPKPGDALCQATTDEEGAYRMDRVASGAYFLVLTRADQALSPMSFLGSLNFDMVTVPAGKEVEYNLVDDSIGGTRVYGHVSSMGEPVSGGQVTAMNFESDSMLGVDVKVARIRGDGSYEFEGLAPGEYQLQIRLVEDFSEARMAIEVPEVPEYQLDLLVPQGRIAGRVLDRNTGEPIQGAWVVAESNETIEPGGMLGSIIGREAGLVRDWSDEDGQFSLDRLQEGEYELTVRSRWSNAYVLEEPIVIDLGFNENYDDLKVLLTPALELTGVVTSSDGLPLEDARVSAWVEGRLDTLEMSSTGSDGRYTLDGLGTGTYRVRATHAGYAAKRVDELEIEGESAELDLALEPGIEVTVEVLSTRGQPISGAAARLMPVEGDEPPDIEGVFQNIFTGGGLTDASGLYVLGHYAPGAYTLQAQRGGDRAEEAVTLPEGSGPVRLSIRLR